MYATTKTMAGAYNEDCVTTDINNPVKELSMSLKKEEDYIRFFFLPPVVDKSVHVFFYKCVCAYVQFVHARNSARKPTCFLERARPLIYAVPKPFLLT